MDSRCRVFLINLLLRLEASNLVHRPARKLNDAPCNAITKCAWWAVGWDNAIQFLLAVALMRPGRRSRSDVLRLLGREKISQGSGRSCGEETGRLVPLLVSDAGNLKPGLDVGEDGSSANARYGTSGTEPGLNSCGKHLRTLDPKTRGLG